jgi:hypothetical protein
VFGVVFPSLSVPRVYQSPERIDCVEFVTVPLSCALSVLLTHGVVVVEICIVWSFPLVMLDFEHMASAPALIQERVAQYFLAAGGGSPKREALCAVHLDLICKDAIQTFFNIEQCLNHTDTWQEITSGTTIPANYVLPPFECVPTIKQGFFVEYGSIPGILPYIMKPLFGIQLNEVMLNAMLVETRFYSKQDNVKLRGTSFQQGQDSTYKEKKAPSVIRHYADQVMEPSYNELQRLTLFGLRSILSSRQLEALNCTIGPDCNWQQLSIMPNISEIRERVG